MLVDKAAFCGKILELFCMDAAFKLALLSYPYHSSKHTGRGHDRYVAEVVENTRRECKNVDLSLLDSGFAKNTLDGLLRLPQQGMALLRSDADVYHAISAAGGAPAALLGRRPLVVTVHDLVPFNVSGYESNLKLRLFQQSVHICLKRADAIIVPYQVTKDELVSRLHADPDKVHVVNYGVDHQSYFPKPEIARAPRTILYVGAVTRSKGVEVLIRAFAQIKARVSDAKLRIGGKSSVDQPMLEGLASSLGVTDVSFEGYISEADLATRYREATVMVFPSHYGFGLSTLEAMACGTPVVGVRALDAPEFFADAGILAEPNNVESLAECLSSVLSNPDLQQDLSQRSIARASLFSWARTARGNVAVYEKVLRRGL
ncbi:MAG TPA: glycosyltransferase family 1 protein [Polyangiaceae bacterium]|nr:glycosyltransferase family 1 protein [Polyangiaceae bacterium]